jgi:hypothetical protein
MKAMTKNEFKNLATKHNCTARYSGKLKRSFLTRYGIFDIHKLINERANTPQQ